MRSRAALLIGLLLATAGILPAQNFDWDSVSYTPIPKTYGLKKKEIKALDTSLSSRSYAYFFSTQVGSLIGCNECGKGKDITSTYSIVNGITLGKKIRVGIGLGFDSYVGWHSLPAFGSISWDIIGNKNKNALFLQLNYGYSKAWNQKSYQSYGYKSAAGGRVISPQIGYRIKYHDMNFSLVAGVKLQRVFSFYEYPTWNWVDGQYQPATNHSTIKQDMSRLMVALVVGWR